MNFIIKFVKWYFESKLSPIKIDIWLELEINDMISYDSDHLCLWMLLQQKVRVLKTSPILKNVLLNTEIAFNLPSIVSNGIIQRSGNLSDSDKL